ncbi:type II toxin-antitoxin system RelB family antitoxin [Paenilisteria newyorkensis]|uniref:type II toxin-antitoxin system RelB family antitoxin n=1 Tax=Listeria newyorkensis TaxID=1497681 RepID=UPI00074112ED|nr:DUF6290 family protein [Listeria newyorkensis]
MATITVHVSDVEKQFLDEMAKLKGKSLSELESLEDEYDARVADYAYGEYVKNPESCPLSETISEYGLGNGE